MPPSPQTRLRTGSLLTAGLRVLGQGLPLFVSIAAVCAVTLIAAGAVVASLNWGVSAGRLEIDPRVLSVTLTGRQFAVIGAGILVVGLVFSYGAAAGIQGAAAIAAGGRIGLVEALSRVQAGALQLFWLQWVVNVLAVRFSVWAAPVLWLLIAPALPLAVLENAGPAEAVDRTAARLRGNLLRMLAMELLLLLAAILAPLVLGVAILPLGALDVRALPPLANLLLSVPVALLLLLPLLYMFIVLTLAYRALAPEAPLHAEAASNVN